ncbi:hypothetical protein CARUB_v10013137mg [Capsella rubella]|uniref:PWWP domain-containing protein n=1 Tax=Capsella rubella TaxID=81985 RepID=R0I129_9BRAS|nr:uncharacterized protein At1g51745 [Capsella rubella]EOA30033.1 hypothetical protein CARUB_v10013137mg [Capsella rubella]
MGSSDERNSKAIDASVGGLVWVRRRNGSWWPGRIMAHHEVPDSTIVSPKSGTPIKLLGREDASVDWYNLEKSKRVKAFRCGEYDACIETAKATVSTTSKKAVKYARREDAIAHALEIESAHLAKDNPECIEKASTSGKVPRRCHSRKGKEDSSDVAETEVALQSSKSSKKNNKVKASKVQSLSGKRRRTPNDSEDDGTEGNKRMRGLEDIGTGRGSKGKLQVGAVLEDKQENGFKSDANINGSMLNGSLANGSSRDCSLSMKRNRSPVVNANEYSKRKTRQRPLTKVLESTSMVSVPLARDDLINSDCLPPPGISENKPSAANNNNNSDNIGVLCENVSVSLNASENVVDSIHSKKAKESENSNISLSAKDDASNGLFDVPLIGEENYSTGIMTAAFTSSSPTKALVSGLTRLFGQSSHNDLVKKERSNGSAYTRPTTTFINGIETSTTKWQIKGKRNSRQMSKKQEERRNAYAEANNNFLSGCSVSDQKIYGQFSFGTSTMGRNSEMYNVKIEVKANYKPRNVPLISLRSKLNGEAIVGHPSTVEVLEDGSCDRIVSSHLDPFAVPMDDDEKPKPSSKKKGKKKKSHIPPYKSSKSKKSSSLSIKTRCLSTLSGQKLTASSKKKMMIEKTKDRIVACIPLKVVFSRINEALKGSTRQVHRSLPSAGNT